MSAAEVDAYLAQVSDPARSTLQNLRETILDLLPDAQEVISYGMPGFAVDGRVLAGFAANKSSLSYYPHSGKVLTMAGDAIAGFSQTKGALHFPNDAPLSRELVSLLIELKRSLHA